MQEAQGLSSDEEQTTTPNKPQRSQDHQLMNPDATFKPKINPRSDMIASRKKLNGTGTQSEAFLRLT